MKIQSSHRRAFSRFEAVALCGVVSLSGAALWPAFAQGGLFGGLSGLFRSREDARSSSCQSNLKQIGLGILQYTQDYDEKMPLVSTPETYDGTYGFGWAGIIQPYLKSTFVFQCPSEKRPARENPSPSQPGYTDYWMNSRVARINLANLNSISQTLLCGDGDGGSGSSTARYNIATLPGSWRTTPGSPARRHLQMGNYLFCDGHVKRLLPTAVTMAPLAQMSKYGASVTFSPR